MTTKHDDWAKSWNDDYHRGDSKGGRDRVEIDESFNKSDDDFNLLSGNQVLSGFQLTLIGDNEDNQGGGLLFWS